MSTRQGYNSGTIATSATTADTIIVPAERIPVSRGVVALHVVTTVVQFQHLTRIAVKVNDKFVLDMTIAEFRQYVQRFRAKGDVAAVYPANAATSWTIPFYALELPDGDPAKYMQQLEPGAIQVELTKNNTPGAGTCRIGWTVADLPAAAYFRATRRALNIAASVTEERRMRGTGRMKGYICHSTGVTEAQLFWNRGTQDNEDWVKLDEGAAEDLIEGQRFEDGSAATDPICRRVHTPVPVDLLLRLITAAGWAGVANEFVVLHAIPAMPAA